MSDIEGDINVGAIEDPNTLVSQAQESEISKKSEGEDCDIQIILVSGYNEPERCTAGLLMAMVCAANFNNVAIFLMMNAVELAAKHTPIKLKVEPFDYIDSYIEQLIAMEVTIEVCTTCLQKFMIFPNQTPPDYLRPGTKARGMYKYAARAKSTRTLMF